MAKDVLGVPEKLNRMFSNDFLVNLKTMNGLPYEELSLFEWYVRETEQQFAEMLRMENEYIQEQMVAGAEIINDSGLLPVRYFIKRSRNSSVLQLATLIDEFFSNACWRLSHVLGDRILFALNELSGPDWIKERKFIERYGNFVIHDDLWKKVKNITDVRNAIVHENGKLSAFTENDRKRYAKNYKDAPGINVEGYELLVGPEFLEFALGAFRELIENVDKNVADVIDRTVQFRAS